jgi:hypothetical protein
MFAKNKAIVLDVLKNINTFEAYVILYHVQVLIKWNVWMHAHACIHAYTIMHTCIYLSKIRWAIGYQCKIKVVWGQNKNQRGTSISILRFYGDNLNPFPNSCHELCVCIYYGLSRNFFSVLKSMRRGEMQWTRKQ